MNISLNFNLFNSRYFFYERLLVLAFSLIPTIALVVFVLYTDKKSKEPSKNIIICLLSGFLTISLAQHFESLVMPYFSNDFVLTYVWASIEEISKILIFYLFIFDNKHYDDIYDGVVYMTLIALSFAGLENIMYAFGESTVSSSISLALMRDFTTIPLHVICGIVIGYFMSLSNFSKDKLKKYINFLLGIIIPSLMHGTFNNFMSLLSKIKVPENNTFAVFFLQALPLVLIMISLFIIAFIYSNKAVILNKVYINNEIYDKKHNYLMNNSEYLTSASRKKRIAWYNMTNFNKNKKEGIDDV